MPFGYPSYADMQEIVKDCLEHFDNLSEWEQMFISNMEPLLAFEKYITKKQLKTLYTIYFQKVDNDPEELTNFIDQYRLHNL